jgi:hypothetical protein
VDDYDDDGELDLAITNGAWSRRSRPGRRESANRSLFTRVTTGHSWAALDVGGSASSGPGYRQRTEIDCVCFNESEPTVRTMTTLDDDTLDDDTLDDETTERRHPR